MTDLSTPGEVGAEVDNASVAHAIGKAGGHDGYVVDGVELADNYASLDSSGVNSFEYIGSDGLEATIDGGEAFVWGWLCRDTPTTVSLPASSTVTISVGFNLNAILSDGQSPADSENVLVGINNEGSDDVDFSDDLDPQLGLYEVTTTSTGVSDVTDLRPLGRGEAAPPPWAESYEHPDTLPGRLTITGDFRDHLRLERSGVGSWDITPTTRNDDSLLISEGGGATDFALTTDGHIIDDNGDYFVKTDRANSYTIVKDGSDGDGVINFKTS